MPRLRERLAGLLLRTAVKAAGSPARLPFVAPSLSGRAIFSDWSTSNAIRHGLKASTWVYSCVGRIADAIASVRWFVEQKKPDGQWEEIDHPLSTLLNYPSPYLNRQDLFERMTYHLLLGGNAIWHLLLVGGVPIEIEPLMPDCVKPIPSATGFLEGYEFRLPGSSEKRVLPPAEVCHLMLADPGNPYWGMAPLQAAARAVDTDVAAVGWNVSLLQNRAVTDGIFSFEHEMSNEQWEWARKTIREQHQGADNAHTPWVLGFGAKYQQMSQSLVDMEFLGGRKFTAEEIVNVFGVPMILLSQERTSFNNLLIARRMFWQDRIIPRLGDVRDALDFRLTPYWDKGAAGKGPAKLRIAFDAASAPAMQEVWNEKLTAADRLWRMGVPFNEVNRRMQLGVGPVPGGDMPFWVLTAPGLGAGPPTFVGGNGDTEDRLAQLEAGAKARTLLMLGPGNGKTALHPAMPEAEKAALWHAHDRDRAAWETKLRGLVAKQLRADGEAVAGAYEKGSQQAAEAEITTRKQAWSVMLKEAYAAMVAHFGSLEGRRLVRQVPKGRLPSEAKVISWRLTTNTPEVERFIRETTGRNIASMTDTTIQHIRDAIAQGVANDESSREIAGRIRDAYETWAAEGDSVIGYGRSYTIARTESGFASNFGVHEGARQVADETGVNMVKEWISSRDDRVRDSHQAVDGEVVAFDENFSNGLPYPCYEGGPPEEVIQCRCVEGLSVEGMTGEE